MNFSVGDIVEMRKAHPCGTNAWRVLYVGADVKIRCVHCARIVMLDRATFEKRVKRVAEHAGEEDILHGE